jgi:hypothetical protein
MGLSIVMIPESNSQVGKFLTELILLLCVRKGDEKNQAINITL